MAVLRFFFPMAMAMLLWPAQDGRASTPSRNAPAAEAFTILDQSGHPAANSAPTATGQIFDVTVGPGGSTQFSPNMLNISAGDSVRWTWDSNRHSVTSGNPCTIDSQFCSPSDTNCPDGLLSNTGTVYQHTFTQPGVYSYFCASHCSLGMTGTVNVAAPALQLTSAISRKSHGMAGTFDIDLPLTGTAGVECRSGGVNSDYSLLFTFTNNVTAGSAMVAAGTATVSGAPLFSANTMTVNLTGVANGQTLTVTLHDVTDQFSQMLPDTNVSIGILIGDSNANGAVNASDVGQTKGRLGQFLTGTNFRSDVNANGSINATDTSIIKAHSGESIPVTPW